ncbi:MAG: transposase [Desulfobacterales bacterium]
MKHIGMDIDSANVHISVFSDRGREIKHTHVRTREADLVAFLLSIPGPKQVALEESQMADFVTRILEPHVTKVVRCLPQHNRLISESEKKYDREDARCLAELLYLNKLKAVHHAPWEYRQLREGVRAYWKVSRNLTRSKNQLKAFFLFNGLHCVGEKVYSKRHRARFFEWIEKRSGNRKLLQQLYAQMDFYQASKAQHVRILKELAKPLRQSVCYLQSVPGIGFIGACTLTAYLENGWRISNKRKLWQYSGVGVRRHESGGTGHRGASRKGNRYLKNAVITAAAAISARREADNALTRMCRAGVEAGLEPDRMRRNLARKVVVIAQRILRFQEEYNDDRVVTTQ